MANWRKTAIQSRSKATERALSRAARELLNEKSFTDIRVDEVARNAGVSVGGYYARFKGKSALLHLADIDFLDAFFSRLNCPHVGSWRHSGLEKQVVGLV